MEIYSVFDEAFRPYGRVVSGMTGVIKTITDALEATPLPEGVGYVPEDPALQGLAGDVVSSHLFGGMPCQIGWCNGHNLKLNCLEYHRDSEFNLGTGEFILLLARQDEIVDGRLDTARVKVFRAPAHVLLEIYATTLHYAPCHTDPRKGFRVMVALPKGTNLDKPPITNMAGDDALLWARNKWLLAHPDSDEAKAGAYIGLQGDNITLR